MIINPTYEKIDDFQISITKTIPVEVVTNTYDLTFLKKQVVDIQAQLDAYTLARQAELDEVNILITEAEKLGIVEKPIEITPLLDKPIL